MSFLFGGGSSKPSFMPRATPSTPRISGGASETMVRESRRRRSANPEDDTILTGLGSVGAQGSRVSRSTLLGSAAS
jgi:hypothetical protein